jgi:hypothetical protein
LLCRFTVIKIRSTIVRPTTPKEGVVGSLSGASRQSVDLANVRQYKRWVFLQFERASTSLGNPPKASFPHRSTSCGWRHSILCFHCEN